MRIQADKKLLRNATRSLEKSVKLIEQTKELEYLISTGENLRPYKVKRTIEDVLSNYQVEYTIRGEECEVSADEGLSSIIDNLVRKRYGGSIDLESSEKGAVFVLRLNLSHYHT